MNSHWLLSRRDGDRAIRTAKADDRAEALLTRVKSVATYLSDLETVNKATGWLTAIGSATPWWVEAVGGSLAESIPLIKFAVSLFEKLANSVDAETQAYLACTITYQRCIAFELGTIDASATEDLVAGRQVIAIPAEPGDLDFQTFDISTATQHPFVRSASDAFQQFLRNAGFQDDQVRQASIRVNERFESELRQFLAIEGLKKFGILREFLTQGVGAKRRALSVRETHSVAQFSEFMKSPLLGTQCFALSEVYVDTDCSLMTWGQLRGGKDPFGDNVERHDLLRMTRSLLSDPNLDDVIVVQGPAGSGKSSFTRRLFCELVAEGLRPIRVRLRDVSPDGPVIEALSHAIARGTGCAGVDPLEGGQIFSCPPVAFGTAQISPYVLLLDGWDELSVGATGDQRDQTERRLQDLRREFFSGATGRPKVRVLITGRPSPTIAEGRFLLKGTPILTALAFTPDQLASLAQKLQQALAATRPEDSYIQPGDRWSLSAALANEVVARYRVRKGSLEVFGLPLLAFLGFRLVAHRPADIGRILADQTELMRQLVSLTCEKGGQPSENVDAPERPVSGSDLRALLWSTATAITVTGEESIPFPELRRRVSVLEDEDTDGLTDSVKTACDTFPLAELMVSFFFKLGGKEQGCEFMHKSFREYLFAEALAEELKRYGRDTQHPPGAHEPLWATFPTTDPRERLLHALALRVAPRGISSESATFLRGIVRLEVQGMNAEAQGHRRVAHHDVRRWKLVAQALSDLWRSWVAESHLRPQSRRNPASRLFELKQEPLVVDWIRLSAPVPLSPSSEVSSVATFDARLGSSLLVLGSAVTSALGNNDLANWFLDLAHLQSGAPKFAMDPLRRLHPYAVIDLREADLRGVDMSDMSLRGARLGGACLSDARLPRTDLRHADLSHADLRNADLTEASLIEAQLNGTDLSGACLPRTALRGAWLFHTNFAKAYLSGTDFRGAALDGCDFRQSDLSGVAFAGAMVTGDLFVEGAALDGAHTVGLIVHGGRICGFGSDGTPAPPKRDIRSVRSSCMSSIRQLWAAYMAGIALACEREDTPPGEERGGQDDSGLAELLPRSVEDRFYVPNSRKFEFRRQVLSFRSFLLAGGQQFAFWTHPRIQSALESELMAKRKMIDWCSAYLTASRALLTELPHSTRIAHESFVRAVERGCPSSSDGAELRRVAIETCTTESPVSEFHYWTLPKLHRALLQMLELDLEANERPSPDRSPIGGEATA